MSWMLLFQTKIIHFNMLNWNPLTSLPWGQRSSQAKGQCVLLWCGLLCPTQIILALCCCAMLCFAQLGTALLQPGPLYSVLLFSGLARISCSLVFFGPLCSALFSSYLFCSPCGTLWFSLLCCGLLCSALLWCYLISSERNPKCSELGLCYVLSSVVYSDLLFS